MRVRYGEHGRMGGRDPRLLTGASTAGVYDDTGKWPYRTGLPGKSGGGIIAVISLPLDDAGNSVRAQKAIADISNSLGGNPYAEKAR